jgi:hypothetical protein
MYGIDLKEGYVVRKLQCGLNSVEPCMCWNIKIDEDKTQAVYFSHVVTPPLIHLTLNGQCIPFVNHVKYVGVIFDKRISWRLHIEMIEARSIRTVKLNN